MSRERASSFTLFVVVVQVGLLSHIYLGGVLSILSSPTTASQTSKESPVISPALML